MKLGLSTLTITLVRHAQSEDNANGYLAGHRDAPLTSLGRSQARLLGKAFQWSELLAVYSSDLKRARETAEILVASNHTVPPPTLVHTRALREQYFGVMEGKSWKETDWKPPTANDDRDKKFEGGGESFEDVGARMRSAARRYIIPRVESLRNAPSAADGRASLATSAGAARPGVSVEGGHIVVVAHGIAIAELLRYFMSLHDSSLTSRSPWPDPRLSYTRVRLENTGFTTIELAVPMLSGGADPALEMSPGRLRSHSLEESHIDLNGHVRTSPSGSILPTGTSSGRPTYVRIVEQNNIQHLRSVQVTASRSTSGLASGPTGLVMPHTTPAMDELSGALGLTQTSASTMGDGASPPHPPSSANAVFSRLPLSAKSVGNYDASFMLKELERAGNASAMLSGNGIADGGELQWQQSQGPASNAAQHQQQAPSSSASQSPQHVREGSLSASATAGVANANAQYSPSPAAAAQLQFGTEGGSNNAAGPYAPSAQASGPSGLAGPTPVSDIWQNVCIRVLPLFNGEGLKAPIEDLNQNVMLHIMRTLDKSPARALDSLSSDLCNLMSTACFTLNAKLQASGVLEDDQRILKRLVELWIFFFGSVLPYLEGVFLPLQTDPVLLSLTKSSDPDQTSGAPSQPNPSRHAPSKSNHSHSTNQSINTAMSISNNPTSAAGTALAASGRSTQKIDVRRICLIGFRDCVILPIYERLVLLFHNIREYEGEALAGSKAGFGARNAAYSVASELGYDSMGQQSVRNIISPRLLQMTTVLASVLSNDEAQASTDALVKALRVGSSTDVDNQTGKGPNQKASATAASAFGLAHSNGARGNTNRMGWLPQSAIKHGTRATPAGQASTLHSTQANDETVDDTSMAVPSEWNTSYFSRNMPTPAHATRVGPATPLRLQRSNMNAPLGLAQYATEEEYLSSLRSPAESSPSPSPSADEDGVGREGYRWAMGGMQEDNEERRGSTSSELTTAPPPFAPPSDSWAASSHARTDPPYPSSISSGSTTLASRRAQQHSNNNDSTHPEGETPSASDTLAQANLESGSLGLTVV
ncbi:gpmB [Ceraceosorus bombacis]|uniref:GpmB n=1 Tax=Ceraceosorus bombacis TaxID=401625 RepID=A0A0P1BH83_9BASI|nr:gpmB [Ceraceosorus bombacis]